MTFYTFLTRSNVFKLQVSAHRELLMLYFMDCIMITENKEISSKPLPHGVKSVSLK